ncbi:restriction endonuclease subunit S [Porphyromonas uenonis]|uniref:restriction endonuclease subunit S n=1 Tax=Porphyromonas uenonis TaxID=281920 RepID=UPI00055EEFC7|nr:restriction endonuclease subunit S [Porphyromonas uenonis]
MLSGVEWGEYRIGDLFERVSTLKLPYKAKDLPSSPEGEFDLPCLTSSFMNQGLNYYVPKSGATILQSVISIPSNSDVYRAYYQSAPFTVLSDAYAIRWIYEEGHPSSELYLFLVSCINKVTDLPIYSYKNKLGGWNVVRKKYIQLPTRDGKINFEFMERFVAELKAQRVAELKAYLTVTGLSDYTLTPEEQQAIQHFQEDNLQWHDYRLGDLFEVKGTLSFNKEALVSGAEYDYVTRTSQNQGILQTTAFVNKENLNEAGTWSLGLLQMDFFYRKRQWYAGQFVRKVVFKEQLPSGSIHFFTTVLNALKPKLLSVLVRDVNKTFLDSYIQLPVSSDKPDYTQMETFIRAIEKLVIRDVVLYADRELAATQQVINQ